MERVLPTAEAVRQHLADCPELSGQEFEAVRTVEEALTGARIRHERVGLNVIGVVGDAGDGPAVLVRGELDALPVAGGAAHLCGHDAHAGGAMATALAGNELHKLGRLPAPLVVVFQSSEEVTSTSGAKEVVDSGRLQELGVGVGVACHVVGDRDVGTVTADAGLVNAVTVDYDVQFTGKSGHGGYRRSADRLRELRELAKLDPAAAHRSRMADQVGIRPTLPASAFEHSLWQAVNEQFGDSGVVNLGRFVAGVDGARNVIPSAATLEMTLRLLMDDPKRLAAARDLIIRTARQAADWWNCKVEIDFVSSVPAVINDPDLAGHASALLPKAGLRQAPERRTNGADDFAFYGGLGVPTLYSFVGLSGAPDWLPRAIHHDEFRAPRDATRLVAKVDALVYSAAVRHLGSDAAR